MKEYDKNTDGNVPYFKTEYGSVTIRNKMGTFPKLKKN